jgi:hypothetical protein
MGFLHLSLIRSRNQIKKYSKDVVSQSGRLNVLLLSVYAPEKPAISPNINFEFVQFESLWPGFPR